MAGFIEALAGFRRWFLAHDMLPDDGPPLKITIEAPTPAIAAAMLFQLKKEFDAVTYCGTGPNIDFNQPVKIMGVEVTFKIAGEQPMPRVYWDGLPSAVR